MRRILKYFRTLAVILLVVSPLAFAAYVGFVAKPPEKFAPAVGHMAIAVLVALIGILFAYVAYANSRRSGDAFLRDLALGFMGFSFLFAPHGIFTGASPEHDLLFDLFGAGSRLVLAAYVLAGTLRLGRSVVSTDAVSKKRLLAHVAFFIVIDLLLHRLGSGPVDRVRTYIIGAEAFAAALFLAAMGVLYLRRARTVLLKYHLISLALFCQASAVFVFAYRAGGAWEHLWWVAHAVFASGFLLLGYAVSVAYERTGSFTTVFSEADLIGQIKEKMVRLEELNAGLADANKKLSKLSDELRVALEDRAAALKMAEERAGAYEEVNKHLVGREQRIIELKREIERLKGEA